MSFDLLAPHYRWMEWLLAGGKLQRCRTACLGSIPVPAKVLIYGEGNGRFLAALCRQFPEAEVTSVDASARMIELARRRLDRHGLQSAKVRFVHADALDWTPPATTYDLIVTHFFLDCFRLDQLRQLVPVIAGAAKPRAHWLLADFKTAGSGFRRRRSQFILALMYLFFRQAARLPARTLTPPDEFLLAAGFSRHQQVEMDWGMLHSDCWRRQARQAGRWS